METHTADTAELQATIKRLQAEIERLQRAALKIADERSLENVELRARLASR
jgi:hypothetical protein